MENFQGKVIIHAVIPLLKADAFARFF